MAGLLPTDIDDPRNQGLLGAALAMLAASGPSPQRRTFGQILGGAGLQGMQQYDQARVLRQRDEENRRRNQLTDMQIQKMQQQLAEEQQVADAARSSMMDRTQMSLAGGGGPTPQNAEVLSSLPQNASAFDQQGFTNKLFGINPLLALKMQQEMRAQKPKPIVAGNVVLDPETYKPIYEPPAKKDDEKEGEYERLIRRANDLNTPPAIAAELRRRAEYLVTRPANEQISIKLEGQKEARGRVSGNLSELYDAYMQLERAGGAIKTGANPVENITNYALSTGPGQIVGSALGTETQAARNRIAQLRPMLIQEVRRATEMGAKGLDSNAELNFYLQAATDPTKDIDSNLAAIEVLDKAYGLNLGIASKKEARTNLQNEFSKSSGKRNPIAEQGGLKRGQIVNGHMYLGGDPNSKDSWAKVP